MKLKLWHDPYKTCSQFTLGHDQVQRELVEGYGPISHLILNGMRILLQGLVSALGNEIVAARTCAVYTTMGDMEARERLTV